MDLTHIVGCDQGDEGIKQLFAKVYRALNPGLDANLRVPALFPSLVCPIRR